MIATAGAGTQALAWLLGVAGASRTLLEALILYDEASFEDFLGQKPPQYVAAQTAGLLAGRAVTRARQLCRFDERIIGLACTATIVTDRPKRGEHRAHISTWTANRVACHSLYLCKGARDRNGEETLVSRLILNTLAQAYELDEQLSLQLVVGDRYENEESDLASAATQLLQGHIDYFGVQADGTLTMTRSRPMALLSGAFNPLHDGHLALARAASTLLDNEITFELTAVNADKPVLSQEKTLERLLQFAGRYSILASNASTFLEKARLFPETTFVLGIDTAERVLQSRFYEHSHEKMVAALAEIRDRGCYFLVAGRVNRDGEFREASQLRVPDGFRELFTALPAQLFRNDISSTQLRAEGKKGSR